MRTLEELQRVINYSFKNLTRLREALTHRSYAFEKKEDIQDNQRLEFFGDAVLEMVASEYLFERYDQSAEGELTKMRSAMTRGEALFDLAQSFHLDEYMFLGRGERQLQGKNQETRVIDAFEALLAAMYLDGGIGPVKEFYLSLAKKCWSSPYELMLNQNPKGNLQELTQKYYSARPEYSLLSVNGQEHDPEFEVEVKLSGDQIGKGIAGSRRKAEEEAARKGIEYLVAKRNDLGKIS
ncbi:MAG: ribonuclease III [Lentisphaerales bacterium]|nr:ribonuclease III [Lentisphaerales bacterium]